MQYTININQEHLKDTGLDLIDAAILDYLYHYCNSLSDKIDGQRILDKDGNKWTWIDYKTLMNDMPLLRITDKSPISRRIKKLESEEFIHSKKWHGYKIFIRLTAKVDILYLKNNATVNEKSALFKNNTNSEHIDPVLLKNNASVAVEQQVALLKNNIDYNTNNYITKTIKNKTNAYALEAKPRVDNRNLDINFCMNSLIEILGHKPTKETINRYAVKRLITKLGSKERVENAIRYAFKIRSEDKYAPQIFNYLDLEDKLDRLIEYGRSASKKTPRAVNISDMIRDQEVVNVP